MICPECATNMPCFESRDLGLDRVRLYGCIECNVRYQSTEKLDPEAIEKGLPKHLIDRIKKGREL